MNIIHENPPEKNKSFEEIQRDVKDMKKHFSSARSFIDYVAGKNILNDAYVVDGFYTSGKMYNLYLAELEKFKLSILRYGASSIKVKQLRPSLIYKAFINFRSEKIKAITAERAKEIEFTGDAESFVQRIKAATKCDNRSVGALQYFMWQVMRNALGLEVQQPRILVVVGPSGSGKTPFLNYLLKWCKDSVQSWHKSCIRKKSWFPEDHVLVVRNDHLWRDPRYIDILEEKFTGETSVKHRATFVGCTHKPMDKSMFVDQFVMDFIDWDALTSEPKEKKPIEPWDNNRNDFLEEISDGDRLLAEDTLRDSRLLWQWVNPNKRAYLRS